MHLFNVSLCNASADETDGHMLCGQLRRLLCWKLRKRLSDQLLCELLQLHWLPQRHVCVHDDDHNHRYALDSYSSVLFVVLALSLITCHLKSHDCMLQACTISPKSEVLFILYIVPHVILDMVRTTTVATTTTPTTATPATTTMASSPTSTADNVRTKGLHVWACADVWTDAWRKTKTLLLL